MLHSGCSSLSSVTTLLLSGPAWQLRSSGVLDVSLGRTEWYADWFGKGGRVKRGEVCAPGGREPVLKLEGAEVPQLRPKMLDADQQRGASWEQRVPLDTLH